MCSSASPTLLPAWKRRLNLLPTPTPSPTNQIAELWSGIVGDNSRAWESIWSDDGETWYSGQTTTNINTSQLAGEKLVSNGYIWVAGANISPNPLFWSLDGKIYSASTNGGTFGVDIVNDVTWDGNKFVVVARSGTTVNKILSSTDGKTWSLEKDFTTTRVRCTAYDGTTYVIAGRDPSIQYSTDLVSYTTATVPNTSSSTSLTDAIYGGGYFVVCGTTPASGSSIWYSSDGINWSQTTASSLTTCYLLCWDGTKYLMGNNDGIWYSTDLDNWTKTSSFQTNGSLVFNGSVYVACGTTGIRVSSDGFTWNTAVGSGGLNLSNTFAIGSMPSPYTYAPVN